MQVNAKIWWTNVQQLGTMPHTPVFALRDAAEDHTGSGWMEVQPIMFETPPIDDVKVFLAAGLNAHAARIQAEADQANGELDVERQRVLLLEEPVPPPPPPPPGSCPY